jgi:hypothetical protein
MALLEIALFGALFLAGSYIAWQFGLILLKILQRLPAVLSEAGRNSVDLFSRLIVDGSAALWHMPLVRTPVQLLQFLYREVIPFPLQRLLGNPRAGLGNWKERGIFDD